MFDAASQEINFDRVDILCLLFDSRLSSFISRVALSSLHAQCHGLMCQCQSGTGTSICKDRKTTTTLHPHPSCQLSNPPLRAARGRAKRRFSVKFQTTRSTCGCARARGRAHVCYRGQHNKWPQFAVRRNFTDRFSDLTRSLARRR